MKITVESTDEIVEVDDGVSARVWVGDTEAGIPVQAYIVAVSPQTHDAKALAAFECELQECQAFPAIPFPAIAAALNPLRDSLVQEDEGPVHVLLGPCCVCKASEGVTNMVMLDRRCAIPGHGWGCVVCGMPNDGAVAVLCEECMKLYQQTPSFLSEACRGYPGTEGRILIAELPPGEFKHDPAIHAAEGDLRA